MDIYLQLIWNSMVMGALLVLLSIPFTIIYSTTRVLYIAQGAMVLVAGYLFYFGLSLGFGWFGATLFAVGASVLLAVAINALVYESLRRRRPLTGTAGMLASLVVLVVLQNVLLAIWSSKTLVVHGVLDGHAFAFGPIIATPVAVATLLIAAVVVVGILLFLRFSKFGRAARAVSDQEEMAEVVGVNTKRTRMLVVAVFSVVTAIAGILLALTFNLYPPLAVGYAVDAFSVSILGGLGNVAGVVPAALIYTLLANLGGFWWTAGIKTLFIFSAVFGFLLLRPRGIFGKKQH